MFTCDSYLCVRVPTKVTSILYSFFILESCMLCPIVWILLPDNNLAKDKNPFLSSCSLAINWKSAQQMVSTFTWRQLILHRRNRFLSCSLAIDWKSAQQTVSQTVSPAKVVAEECSQERPEVRSDFAKHPWEDKCPPATTSPTNSCSWPATSDG